ncbi:MAG: endonuclease/exonuclease/phosphatase family protein [Ruminococcus sp.]|nr:endonuclease/exonuclease/phosphatase family protein [Ruminococcus sp.]
MRRINIMTWNVDWFRNGKRSGKPKEYFEKDYDSNSYVEIVNIIKEFLEHNNAIAFIQEVPNKIKDNNGWRECAYLKRLIIDFPNDVYDISLNNAFTTRYTLSISKKSVFKNVSSYKPSNNRTIAKCIDDVTLLSVHMPTGFASGDSNDKMWDALIYYAKLKKDKKEKLIIVGDFNTYTGCKDKSTETKYNELLKFTTDITDIVPANTITFVGNTPIDHILINYDLVNKATIQVQPSFDYSDHKFLKCKI